MPPARRDPLYGTTAKLGARIRLHQEFTSNPLGWFPWLVSQIRPARFDRVLEVGCGEGSLWARNAKTARPPYLVIADTSPAMLQRTGEVLGRSDRGVRASVDALPFRDAAFDAVLANHMLYHASDVPTAIAELRRVLRTGGHLFASTNGPNSSAELHALVATLRPDYQPARLQDRFGLHNAPNMLAEHFDEVRVVPYDNHLEVTDAGAIVDYVRSLEACADLGADEVAELESRVRDAIDTRGFFHVTGDAGLLTAVARS